MSLDVSLSSRIQKDHIRDQQTLMVTKVEKLEPLRLQKEWMDSLAQAVTFLESLNLAHGDLRPENILLDGNRLQLSDFDCTAEIGTDFEACMAPYGRILNSNDMDQGQGRRGTSGFLGPRAEQFALGSLYYLINYGFEVYGNQRLTEDPREHGPKVVDLLQNMEFPELDGNPRIDDIINKCWHNRYATVGELAGCTQALLNEEIEPDSDSCHNVSRDQDPLANDFSSKRALCQDLATGGLLDLLSSGEPEQLGFTLEWYRHTTE